MAEPTTIPFSDRARSTRRRPAFVEVALSAAAVAAVALGSSGLEARAQGAACEGVAPVAGTALRAVTVVDSVAGTPVLVTAPAGDADRLFVVTQSGRIELWRRGDPPASTTTFLDLEDPVLAGGERGLLGLAFSPDHASDGYFYVNYTDAAGDSVVSRFSVSATDPDVADPSSEVVLMTYDQPAGNHNAGQLAFDSNGYLYIATGDGGGADDTWGTCGNGQDTKNLLGAILRIDPTSGQGLPADCGNGPYRIPADNALADGPGGDCDEVWAFGLRNPWRFDIDPENDDLYIGDVGQSCIEEIDWVRGGNAGGYNFGWRQMEGSLCFDGADFDCDMQPVACGSSPACNDPSLTLPVAEYPHSGECAVIGGAVYRGCRMPDLDGLYFFGDRCSGDLRSFRIVGGAATDLRDRTAELDPQNLLANDLTSFGRDGRGELYLLDGDGQVRKIVPPFGATEVSGPGAPLLRATAGGGWTWEDVQYETMVPVATYRVWRGPAPDGELSCVRSDPAPEWIPGDAATPAPGGMLAYVVTAVDATGAETSPGGSARTLVDPCPAP